MIEDKLLHFEDLLRQSQRSTGAKFADLELERLKNYYGLVLKWNPRLHLTTLTAPFQFFHRHIFESDFAETFISPQVEQVWDLGTGLGVPGVPLAILRPDLTIYLVESKRGKVIFLEEVISALRLSNAKVVQARIESLSDFPANSCLIARAIEQMESLVFEMFGLEKKCRQIIVLGSAELGEKLKITYTSNYQFQITKMPGSDQKIVASALSST